MGECCNICGDIGCEDFLLTCIRCKINHEHVYCLKVPLEEPIDNWHCEECESASDLEVLESGLENELPRVSKLTPSEEVISDSELHALSSRLPNKLKKGSFGWEKGVARGKTKYIPVKDALKLSSKDIKSRGRLVVTLHPKSQGPQPKVGVVISEKAPVRSLRVPLGFSPFQNLASGHFLQQSKTRIKGKMGNIEGQPQQIKNLTGDCFWAKKRKAC